MHSVHNVKKAKSKVEMIIKRNTNYQIEKEGVEKYKIVKYQMIYC